MFLCPHSCSFVFCDNIWGVVHSRKLAQARRDQNRSTITCVRRRVCFARCKIVFRSILDQNAPIHEAMKRKYAKEYSIAQKQRRFATKAFACKSFRNNVHRLAPHLILIRYNLWKPVKPFRVNIAKSTYAGFIKLHVVDFL